MTTKTLTRTRKTVKPIELKEEYQLYIASDGLEFDTEDDCKQYENMLKGYEHWIDHYGDCWPIDKDTGHKGVLHGFSCEPLNLVFDNLRNTLYEVAGEEYKWNVDKTVWMINYLIHKIDEDLFDDYMQDIGRQLFGE